MKFSISIPKTINDHRATSLHHRIFTRQPTPSTQCQYFTQQLTKHKQKQERYLAKDKLEGSVGWSPPKGFKNCEADPTYPTSFLQISIRRHPGFTFFRKVQPMGLNEQLSSTQKCNLCTTLNSTDQL